MIYKQVFIDCEVCYKATPAKRKKSVNPIFSPVLSLLHKAIHCKAIKLVYAKATSSSPFRHLRRDLPCLKEMPREHLHALGIDESPGGVHIGATLWRKRFEALSMSEQRSAAQHTALHKAMEVTMLEERGGWADQPEVVMRMGLVTECSCLAVKHCILSADPSIKSVVFSTRQIPMTAECIAQMPSPVS